MLLLSDKLMSCCAAGTNGCLDLRHRELPLYARVSAEWSRCLGSMAWRAEDSVAPLRRSSAGWMPARIQRLSAGVGRRHPVTIRKASLLAGLMRWVWAPGRCAVLYGWVQVYGGYLQSCCCSTPAGASKPPQECDVWCQLLAKWLKMSAVRYRPVQGYSHFRTQVKKFHSFSNTGQKIPSWYWLTNLILLVLIYATCFLNVLYLFGLCCCCLFLKHHLTINEYFYLLPLLIF